MCNMEKRNIKLGIMVLLLILIIIVNYNHIPVTKLPSTPISQNTTQQGEVDINPPNLPENQTEDLESTSIVLQVLSGLEEG